MIMEDGVADIRMKSPPQDLDVKRCEKESGLCLSLDTIGNLKSPSLATIESGRKSCVQGNDLIMQLDHDGHFNKKSRTSATCRGKFDVAVATQNSRSSFQKSSGGRRRACCCFRNYAGWPVFIFVHGLIFLMITYLAYTAWAIVVLKNWNLTCTQKGDIEHISSPSSNKSDGTFEYIALSVVALSATMVSGCYVGTKVYQSTCLITVIAAVTDAIVVGMFVWGIYLAMHRTERCKNAYAVDTPTYAFFFRVTTALWMLHLIVVGIIVNRWGRIRTEKMAFYILKANGANEEELKEFLEHRAS